MAYVDMLPKYLSEVTKNSMENLKLEVPQPTSELGTSETPEESERRCLCQG